MADDRQGHSDHDHSHGHLHDSRRGGVLAWLTDLWRPHSHGAADRLDRELTASAEGIQVVKLALLCLAFTALIQLGVAMISGSVALLADTIHNFADASTAFPLWVAFSIARRPPSRRYTYGFGRAEDLAGVFVVLMIGASSAFGLWECIQKFAVPQSITNLPAVAAAGLLGFGGNELVARLRIRTGERIGSAALVADGQHARTDALTSLAVLVSAAGVWLGFPLADPLIGLGINIAILFILKDAALQVWRRLMDAVDPELLEQVQGVARQVAAVQDVSMVRARWIGHSIHAEVQITADRDLPLSQAHEIGERVRHALLHDLPGLADVIVHVDPCSHDGSDPHADLVHHDRRVVGNSVGESLAR